MFQDTGALEKEALGQTHGTQELNSNKSCVIVDVILCISFRLFQGGKGGTNSVKTEKLQAIFHYFRRITKESK